MPSDIKVLKAARKRIEKGWTQGAFARTKDYEQCLPRSKDAVKWCIYGAVRASATNYDQCSNLACILADQRESSSYCSLHLWNDAKDRTKEQVLRLIDRAIETLTTPA